MPATKIVVNLPDEPSYDVRVGTQILDELGGHLRTLDTTAASPHVLIISDTNVAPHYLAAAKASLERAGYRRSEIVVPAGESSKSLTIAHEVWEAMAALDLGRDCCVVALGGGVVGDLSGFVASTFMRGIPVVQVPTSLLAMVDSSVGGKTAINLEAGKNLVGTFTQPVYVCASTDTLTTLPPREWVCGCAEIAKAALIDSDDFFFWLCEHATEIADRDIDATTQAIVRAVVFKANVVAADKTEKSGIRECLNYGHTLAHAIEVCAGFGTFTHGEAVAEGMRFAAHLACDMANMPTDLLDAQETLLDNLGLHPLEWTEEPKTLLEAMKRDKKCRGGKLRFVLPHDVGSWDTVEVDDDVALSYLRAWASSPSPS